MLYRASVRLLSLATRSDTTLFRAAVHSSGPQLVKKNPETGKPTAAPVKDKTATPKSSNDSYQSGEVFFGHNAYTFYDEEIDMAKDRIKQPSCKEDKKPLAA